MKIYIAGPVTGYPDGNKAAFAAAAAMLREVTAWEVVSPLEMDSPEEFAATMADHYGSVYWHRMVEDFKTVIAVDGLFLLPGWERSKGARIEVFTALSLDKLFWEPGTYRENPVLDMAVGAVRERLASNMP